MKKNILKINTSNHFISSWSINDEDLDEIIDYFNSSHENHIPGVFKAGLIDKTKKDCIELSIKPKDVDEKKLNFFFNYLNKIKNCYTDYIEQWSYPQNNSQKIYIGSIKIEKYLLSGHQKEYQCDRNDIHSSHKSLSWITFLNNTKKLEGCMNFKNFDYSIQPKKGLTLMWPSDWTHLNNHDVVKTQDKLIIRGNIQFTEN
jgi:hypothetical protein